MASETERLIDALSEVIRSEVNPEAQAAKNRILNRVADETEVKTTRIPVPLNITEVGGYFNLIDQVGGSAALDDQKAAMKLAVIASALSDFDVHLSASYANVTKKMLLSPWPPSSSRVA